MKKKTATPANLMRQMAAIWRKQDIENRRQRREFELKNKRLEKRVTKLEGRNERLTSKIAKQANGHRPRQRQRHVKHNLTQLQKANLLRTWDKYRQDETTLAGVGRQLASGFKLDYQRQVCRWFKVFDQMSNLDIRLLRRDLKKHLVRTKG